MGVTVIGGSGASGGGAGATLGTATVKDIHNPGRQIFPDSSFSGSTNADINTIFFSSMAIIPPTGDVFGVNTNDDLYYWQKSTSSDAYAALHSVYTGTQGSVLNINTPNDSSPRFSAVTVHPDGDYVYLLNYDAFNEILRLSMTTPGEPSTTQNTGTSYKLGTDLGITDPGDTAAYLSYVLQFNGDGTKLYLKANTSASLNELIEVTLSTGFDLNTAVSNTIVNLSTLMNDVSSAFYFDNLVFNPTGEFFSVTDTSADELAIFKCSTPYDFSTAEYVTKYYSTSALDNARSMVWNLDSAFLSVQPSTGGSYNGYYIATNLVDHKNETATLEVDLSTGNRFIINDTNFIRNYNVDLINAPAAGTLKEAEITLSAYPDAQLMAETSNQFFYSDDFYDLNSSYYRTGSKVYPLSGGDFFITAYNYNGARGTIHKFLDKRDPDGFARGQVQGRKSTGSAWTEYSYKHEYMSFHSVILDSVNYVLVAISPDARKYYLEWSNVMYTYALPTDPFTSFSTNDGVLIDQTPYPLSSGYYNLSNDGRFLYRTAGTNISNYQLTTPWDMSTLNTTVHSTATLPFTCDYGNVGVGFNGHFAQMANPNESRKFYFFNMSTAHDLSTLSDGYASSLSTQSDRCAQISHDNMYGVRDSHSSSQYNIGMFNLGMEHHIGFKNNVLTNQSKTSFYTSKPTTFTLSTVDGGATYVSK